MDKQTVEAIGNEVRKTGRGYFKVVIPVCIASLLVLIGLIVFLMFNFGAAIDKAQDHYDESVAKAMEQYEETNAEIMSEVAK